MHQFIAQEQVTQFYVDPDELDKVVDTLITHESQRAFYQQLLCDNGRLGKNLRRVYGLRTHRKPGTIKLEAVEKDDGRIRNRASIKAGDQYVDPVTIKGLIFFKPE